MADHDALIEQARALADSKEFADAAALLEDHLDETGCATAYADFAQRGGLGEDACTRVHYAIRNIAGMGADARLMEGLYDAL